MRTNLSGRKPRPIRSSAPRRPSIWRIPEREALTPRLRPGAHVYHEPMGFHVNNGRDYATEDQNARAGQTARARD